MTDTPIHIIKLDSDAAFGQFASDLGSNSDSKNKIELHSSIGQGTIRKTDPEKGLSIRAYDVTLHKNVELHKHSEAVDAAQSFNLIYVITYESCYLKTIRKNEQYVRPASRNTLALSNDVDVSLQVLAEQPVQILGLGITAEWLKQHFFSHNTMLDYAWEKALRLRTPLIVLDMCTAAVNLNVNELHAGVLNQDLNPADLISISKELVSSFLHSFLNIKRTDIEAAKSVHRDKIMQVEAFLLAHLLKPLPSLEFIARNVAMSESTLKRHFKTVRGKSIYEYYLEKKMSLAKDLLIERSLHVNEVAEKLGYENVSNFIHIFKKIHGFSPGSVKKKTH